MAKKKKKKVVQNFFVFVYFSYGCLHYLLTLAQRKSETNVAVMIILRLR